MGHTPNSKHSEKRKAGQRLANASHALQYGAICLRPVPDTECAVKVLLITSRDTGRWVIPKGWGMAKKQSYEVAKQEAWEEAGVKGRVWKKALGSYQYAKVLDGGDVVQAFVRVHLIMVSRIEQDFPEKGQRTSRWFEPAEAAEAVREPELKSLIAKVPHEVAKLLGRSPNHAQIYLPISQLVP